MKLRLPLLSASPAAETQIESPSASRGPLLQWHITERCNLRCAHCYQESYVDNELAFPDLLGIVDQYKAFLKHWAANNNQPFARGHITVTGGEPFVRKDFMSLLEAFDVSRSWFSFAILTNGTFITEPIAERLQTLRPSFVQVSIEGSEPVHDAIRGSGSLQRTVEAIRHMVGRGIRVLVSFTAHRGNYRQFPEVVRLCRSLGVHKVWSDRLIPLGQGTDLDAAMLSPQETREFFETMACARCEEGQLPGSRTEVSMHRALQFLVAGGSPYRCTAGDRLITLAPNGDLYPCRRLPINVGNVLSSDITTLYYESPTLRSLREATTPEKCRGCSYSSLCRGGLRCLSYATTGNPFEADPGCWHCHA